MGRRDARAARGLRQLGMFFASILISAMISS